MLAHHCCEQDKGQLKRMENRKLILKHEFANPEFVREEDRNGRENISQLTPNAVVQVCCSLLLHMTPLLRVRW